jgi:hypothetical protein
MWNSFWLVFSFTNRVRACFTQNYRNEATLVSEPTTIVQTCTLVERQTCRRIQSYTADHSKLRWLDRKQGTVNGSRRSLTAVERLNPRKITAQAPSSVMCLVSIN